MNPYACFNQHLKYFTKKKKQHLNLWKTHENWRPNNKFHIEAQKQNFIKIYVTIIHTCSWGSKTPPKLSKSILTTQATPKTKNKETYQRSQQEAYMQSQNKSETPKSFKHTLAWETVFLKLQTSNDNFQILNPNI